MWHRGHVPDDDTLTEESRRTGTRGRSPLTWLVAVTVVLVIAGATLFALLGRDSDDDEPPSGTTSGAVAPDTVELVAEVSSERCMLPDVGILRQQDLAFDGVVRSVAGGHATLEPTHFFAGDETGVVIVKAPDGDLQALLSAVDFREGERYLVSATDGRVTLCGFSGPHTEALAQLYAEAFAR